MNPAMVSRTARTISTLFWKSVVELSAPTPDARDRPQNEGPRQVASTERKTTEYGLTANKEPNRETVIPERYPEQRRPFRRFSGKAWWNCLLPPRSPAIDAKTRNRVRWRAPSGRRPDTARPQTRNRTEKQ